MAEECLAMCRRRNNPAETAWPLTCLGEIATRRGDFAAAHAALDEAQRLGRYTDSYWRVMIVRADLGDLALAEGQPEQALRYYRETLPVLLQAASSPIRKGRCAWRGWRKRWASTRSPPPC
ncbi:MAG: tetratricopeptide repeat protein [Caldilineales bacterium]